MKYKWKDILESSYLGDWDPIDGITLIDEAIESLEDHFQYMDFNELIKMSRYLAVAYLALLEAKSREK